MYKYEVDANFDGRVDLIVHFDELGMPSRQESDSNFDGQIETQMRFRQGNPVRSEVDTDRDRVADFIVVFENGIVKREEILDPAAGQVARINHYENLRLHDTEIDADRDGFLETLRTYDRFGEVLSIETRSQPRPN